MVSLEFELHKIQKCDILLLLLLLMMMINKINDQSLNQSINQSLLSCSKVNN